MLKKTMKCVSVAGLLLASMSWNSETTFQLLLNVAVYVSAIIMLQQAARALEYIWATVLAGMMLLLNPVVPVFTPAGNLAIFLLVLALSPLLIGFAALMDAKIQRDDRTAPARSLYWKVNTHPCIVKYSR